jgi:hypothetical protein
MIRIETTAEIDADGQLTVACQAPKGSPPGAHKTVVFVCGVYLPDDPAAQPQPEGDGSYLKRINGRLVWTGPLPEPTERIYDERAERILWGLWD